MPAFRPSVVLHDLTFAWPDGSPAIVGSFLLDGPGRWWIGVSVPYADCVWQQPIDVTAG